MAPPHATFKYFTWVPYAYAKRIYILSGSFEYIYYGHNFICHIIGVNTMRLAVLLF